MSLVIKSWKVNHNPAPNEPMISIQGRQAGLIGFMLSLVGMDPTVKFTLSNGKVTYTASSWGGTRRVVIPVSKVCTGYFGYTRPWKEALVIGMCLLPVFGIGLIAGPLYYFLNKRLEFGVRATSGEGFPFAFQRSVIEGQNIDEQAGHTILDMIEKHVQEHNQMPMARAA
ncbi:hypothetical protein [Bdellovibrio bacteriovorus]|uniref:Uncharacterized protein n=1 Tax=Bdellovibrio bacteriovorus str. Tiberius TaxID=1069642 RepID=K7YKA0_BDEBC|nr:hypothetical protein [Bdellovibrio bacteriovorus]AFY00131.1 hypothetical protein Bdt_0423 [Bdellovibrio bacteriovorus str. Tiberius]